jgi:hypothetical protein
MSSDLEKEKQVRAVAEDRAVAEAAGYVRDTIKPFTDTERKRIIELALGELNSQEHGPIN